MIVDWCHIFQSFHYLLHYFHIFHYFSKAQFSKKMNMGVLQQEKNHEVNLLLLTNLWRGLEVPPFKLGHPRTPGVKRVPLNYSTLNNYLDHRSKESILQKEKSRA